MKLISADFADFCQIRKNGHIFMKKNFLTFIQRTG